MSWFAAQAHLLLLQSLKSWYQAPVAVGGAGEPVSESTSSVDVRPVPGAPAVVEKQHARRELSGIAAVRPHPPLALTKSPCVPANV